MTTADYYGDHSGPARRPFGLMMALLAALLALAAVEYWKLSQPAVGPYGAIAISGTSLTFGGAWGFSDPVTAHARAVAECTQAGATDCTVRVSLKGDCAALVVSVENNASYVITGRDQAHTTATALQQCRASGAGDCQVREKICATHI